MVSTWQLPDGLPPGGYVTPLRDDDRDDDQVEPVLWVSDEPVPRAGALRAHLQPACTRTGLWPLVLLPLDGEPWAPWHDGELDPVPLNALAGRDPGPTLARLWHALADVEVVDDELVGAPGSWRDALVELGLPAHFEGLAPAGTPITDPDQHAAQVSAEVFHDGLLGLVPAACGSDAIAVLGWDGALNHTGTAEIALVTHSWEDRFGARVIGLGYDTLELSVAAPPASLEHARAVAAEHFAFCPDNIAQGTEDFDLYARHLVGAPTWSFWWD
ncbi:MAG TPA: DUF4253 domain-containing protein [Rugosimonospora sp.]|nr:DUF4253 domain-containing protein [Rugosimonospora sp.]